MLVPSGRAVLIDELRPPNGFELGHAIATTYTLDLSAALVAPRAFASSQLGDAHDPIAVMEAIRDCADRVDIFCQAGNIDVPRQASDLVEFLGQMVHQVRRPRPGHLFHPKLWFLRFDSPDESPRFRLLVLTRNLTSDRSWDLVLRLDDTGSHRRNHGNDPYVALLESLLRMAPVPPERADAVRRFAEDLRHVTWELPDGVNEIRFWALGIGLRSQPNFAGYRHLVVSPFVTEGGLEFIRQEGSTGDVTLVSRSEELDGLEPGALNNIDTYTLEPFVGADDTAEELLMPSEASTGSEPPSGTLYSAPPPGLRDLHAKLIIVERSKRAHVFVGSPNATDAAFNGNVEVLCELIGGATKLGVATVLHPVEGLGALLQVYRPGVNRTDPLDTALERRLDEALRRAAEVPLTATVGAAGGELWEVNLTAERPLADDSDIELIIAPLNRPAEQLSFDESEPIDLHFSARVAADITAFYIVTGNLHLESTPPRSTVVRANLVGAPAGRLHDIVARQVDTPEKFLRFVFLLLGIAGDAPLLTGRGHNGDSAAQAWSFAQAGLLELLANALVSRPRAIDDLAGLIDHLSATSAGRQVLPEGWQPIWEAVSAARRRMYSTT